MKIYIAGKITNENIKKCYRKFKYAKLHLEYEFIISDENKKLIYPQVIIPLELEGIYFGISHKEAMDICLNALGRCTHAFFLEDWKRSKGAIIEHEYCVKHGITIMYENPKDADEFNTMEKPKLSFLKRLEKWLDYNLVWFFVNGNKQDDFWKQINKKWK